MIKSGKEGDFTELLQLKYFCDAAQTQNFSKTAQKYFVPPSNISQSICRLEDELDIKLFDRSANKIQLNKNGKEFYTRVSKALSLIEEAKKSVHDEVLCGEIRLCVRTNRRCISGITEKFKKLYPEVSFVINHSFPASNDEYDLIIADDTLKCSNMKKELLIREDLLLAIDKDNPLTSKVKITKKDLETQKFITLSPPGNLYGHTVAICNSMGFSPNIVIQCDDPHYVRKYVSLGWGIAFVPSYSWNELFEKNVVLKKIGDFKRNTYVIWNENKFVPKRVKLFLDMLRNELNIE